MEKLNEIQSKHPTLEVKEQEENLLADLEENLIRKDLIWRQKSRELWLKDGDRNTKFFHLSTVIRRRANQIVAIKDDNGEWSQDQEVIGDYFLRKFQDLFKTSNPALPEDMEDLIGSIISAPENERLIQAPDDKEILIALNSIPNLKAPGPDGIPSLFYKHYGETVKPLLCSAVKSFFNSGFLLKEWNNTFISLIPKCQGASTFKDFRPISLCNILEKLGFHPTFISWIYQCISTTTFSILLNGSLHGHFSPSRCIRQGDPISPYLFVISMEMLSRLLYRAEVNGDIKGIQISRGGPQISHLMFADDLLILLRATKANIRNVKSILDKFCSWSGQEVNRAKSGLFFSKNTMADERRNAKSIIGIRKLKDNSKYLGNPLFIKRKRKESFQFLIDKIKSKLASWKAKSLSWAGRATLINSVVNNTPIYTMSLFRLPKSTLSSIDKVTRRIASECLPWFSEENSPCPLCQTSSDKLEHLYGDCLFYRVAWRESPWDMRAELIPSSTTRELINSIVCPPRSLILNINDKAKFSLYAAITLYHLWNSRNNVLHVGTQADLHDTIKSIKNRFMEHNRGNQNAVHDNIPNQILQLEPSRIPTGPGWSILSTDAAWSRNRSCLSGVLHHPNNPPSLSWFKISCENTPIQSEARAALLALNMAFDRGSTKIWLRCDALLLVEAILHPHSSPWEIRSIVSDILASFSLFSNWICSWIPRTENTLAHDLSQFGWVKHCTSTAEFSTPSPLEDSTSANVVDPKKLVKDLCEDDRDVEEMGSKSELEQSFDSPTELESDFVDVLKWWNDKKSTYKILSYMAKYILAIPVATIASKSAFSTSGRNSTTSLKRLWWIDVRSNYKANMGHLDVDEK
ncbi:hypothetical protein CRG98_014370 [Punica granatum]|uniref:Reverse transcriptase domain-containing protein n=1 Tax=Punica granatum TaxID=22663 RepID=A0A2I0K9K6_PUNGR|nr:hypothetical protein CRG98_014370 [Punica granatum]